MKVAIVSPYPPSQVTLNEYGYHLIQYFKEKPEISKLFILTDHLPDGQTYDRINGSVDTEVIPCWSFNSWMNIWHIARMVKKHKVDIALFNIQFLSFGDGKIPATLGLWTPALCRLMGIPSVVLLHNILETVDLKSAGITKNPVLTAIYRFFGWMITKFILRANLVAVTIPKYTAILKSRYKAKNIALVPHGSFEHHDLPDFEHSSDRWSVMTFGKFGTYKKVEGMIEAIVKVRDRLSKPIDIIIAGTDSPNLKGYLKGVKEKYHDVEDLHFLGYVEEEQVPEIFRSATVVLFDYTSTTGSSGVLHQAGSYGKAAIIPKVGDLKELIEEEGFAGAYFEPGDIDGMADAVEKLLTDEEYRNRLGEKNYIAAASLPMEDITDWYLLHFKRILNGL